jgi:hypothetical protein
MDWDLIDDDALVKVSFLYNEDIGEWQSPIRSHYHYHGTFHPARWHLVAYRGRKLCRKLIKMIL